MEQGITVSRVNFYSQTPTWSWQFALDQLPQHEQNQQGQQLFALSHKGPVGIPSNQELSMSARVGKQGTAHQSGHGTAIVKQFKQKQLLFNQLGTANGGSEQAQ